jgi:hypothetical protein
MVCKPSGRLLRHRETIGFCPLQAAKVANIGQFETVTAFFGGFFGGGCGLCHRETFAFSGVGVAFADIVRPLRHFCGWWSALFIIVRLSWSLRHRETSGFRSLVARWWRLSAFRYGGKVSAIV